MVPTKQIPILELRTQYALIRDEIQASINRVIESQHFILGPEVEALENEISVYSRCKYGIGVSSGTDALLAALMAIDIQPGDQVITTPFSFFATAGCIARLGAVPVFVDIQPDTYNIAPELIEKEINEKTRAIMPVHLFGQMADMQPIIDLARKYQLYVIEDAAQAIGAEYRGYRAGEMGDITCFSFFPSKNLGAFGDAGMVLTNSQPLADKLRMIRSHGAKPKYYHQIIGANFRLDAIQAAILRVKLKYLDKWTETRQRNAQRYRDMFVRCGLLKSKQINLPVEAPNRRHIYNQFVIRCLRRNELQDHLKKGGIATEVYYPLSLHQQPCFAELGYCPGSFPASEQAAEQTLAIPVYPEITEEDQLYITNAIGEFLKKHE